jgi:hemoglobin/transferrin/lactoferrin receptor protein
MKYFISSFLLAFGLSCFAQRVVLKDAVTHQALPNVSVVDIKKEHFSTSDSLGIVYLDSFSDKAQIRFIHMGYSTQQQHKSQIKANQIIWMIPGAENLNEIVLSVSRMTVKKQRLAQQVGILTQDEIQKQSPENTAVMLREVPGVRVQQSQGGGGSPVLRGFEANRVLLVVDGVRLNNGISRSGHLHNALTIDPLSLSRTEIIFGPSSVGYGSDALGGVIHFYTKTPLINQDKKIHFSGSSSYAFKQNTLKQSLHFEYSAPKWAMLQQLSFSKYGDVVMGNRRAHGYNDWGEVTQYSQNNDRYFNASPSKNSDSSIQQNSGYQQLDLFQKWIYHSSNGIKFTLNLQGSTTENIPRFDKLTEKWEGDLRFARWEYGPQKRILVSPQLSFVGNTTLMDSGKIIAAVQLLEESRIQRKFSSLSRQTQQEQVYVYSLNADFKAKTLNKSELSYGAEITHNRVRSVAFAQQLVVQGTTITSLDPKTAIATRYPSAGSTYATVAAYMDYRKYLTPKSTLNLGARHTLTEIDARWSEQSLIDVGLGHVYQNHQSSNVTIGFNYQSKKQWQLKALFSTGFRAPNIDDLGKTRENNGLLSVPNLELKPEYIYSTDLGARKQWEDGSYIEGNGYFAFVNDYIARGPYMLVHDYSTSDPKTMIFSGDEVITTANINVGSVKVAGFSTQAKLQLNTKLSYQGSATLTKGWGNTKSGNLPSISPLFIAQKLEWELLKGEVSLRWYYAGAKAAHNYSPWGEDGLEETPLLSNEMETPIYAGAPSWHRWDIEVGFPLSNAVKLSGGIFNLWDTHYREFASGISAPGRTLKLVVRYDL